MKFFTSKDLLKKINEKGKGLIMKIYGGQTKEELMDMSLMNPILTTPSLINFTSTNLGPIKPRLTETTSTNLR
jgi:hypothetical protein